MPIPGEFDLLLLGILETLEKEFDRERGWTKNFGRSSFPISLGFT
jgi:hypothetical protein